MAHLHLLGTSHISADSISQVKTLIERHNPDIIAIELDIGRFQTILLPERPKPRLKDIKQVGVKGFLFQLLGAWAEKKLGEIVGVKPGEEMKTAIELAKQKQKKIALIDQPIQITLKKLSKSISWKEKRTFILELLSAPFRKKNLPFDLRSVPKQDLIENMLKEVHNKYPNVYRVLLTERNHYMAKKLTHILNENPEATVLAIVGAGHIKEMHKLLSKHINPL